MCASIFIRFLWRARKSNARSKTASVVVKDFRFKDEDKDKESIFKDKDKDFPRGQQHCKHWVSNKHPQLLEIHTELSEYQPYTSYVIATPAQSADTDSLLSPGKFSRTWTSEDEDKDKDICTDLKIGPRGSSRTRTFLEDNNTENSWHENQVDMK